MLRRYIILGHGIDVSVGVYRKISKEIFLVEINAAEPAEVRDQLHSFHLADPFLIGNRKSKDQRDRISGPEPVRGGSLDAHVPGGDDRPQEPERENGDRDTEDGQTGAKLVAESILKEQFENEHRSRNLFQGA